MGPAVSRKHPRVTSDRARLEHPHAIPHEESLRRNLEKGREPRDLRGLLRWYQAEVEAEVPDRLHTRGVWRDWGQDAEGGSHLGTPTFSDPFRRFIEGNPFEVAYATQGGTEELTPHFARPMQAALAVVAGHDERSLYYQRAIFLYRLAWSGFQYRAVCAYLGLPEWTWEWVTEQALRLLWDRYQVGPDAREVAA
jgi:hypothetical protein